MLPGYGSHSEPYSAFAKLNYEMSRRKRATYFEKSADTGGREKIAKKSFIRAKEYASLAFDAALTKCKANAAWKIYEMAGGHDAMVIQPDSQWRF
jgi:hypothetical protein